MCKYHAEVYFQNRKCRLKYQDDPDSFTSRTDIRWLTGKEAPTEYGRAPTSMRGTRIFHMQGPTPWDRGGPILTTFLLLSYFE